MVWHGLISFVSNNVNQYSILIWNIGYHFIQCKITSKIKLVWIHLCCVESMQQQVDEYIVTDTAV